MFAWLGGPAVMSPDGISLPLWLIYVFVGSLCGGLIVYVGSLGRI
jgi:hypothetical protein